MTAETSWETSGAKKGSDSNAIVSRPKLGIADVILQLWRSKWLMALIAVVMFLPFLLLAMAMPTKYEASAGLLVSLGEEQVYRPLVGNEAAGAIPEQELINQAEIELLSSQVVAERVIDKFTLEVLYPDILENLEVYEQKNPGRDPMIRMRQEGVEAIRMDFSSWSPPKSNVIRAVFAHEDADLSADVLNEIINSYIEYRSEVYLDTRSNSFAEQRQRFERDLSDIEDEIRQFLIDNRIGDFDAEFAAAQSQYTAVTDQLLTVEARATSVEGQLITLARQLNQTSPLVDIFVEDSTQQTLIDLNVEREEALSRYTPESRTVRAIDKRIEQVESYLSQQSGAVGTRRTGPNPVYQDMEQRRSGLEAESRSLDNQRAELERQKAQLSARLRLFNTIRPDWQELLRNRSLIESSLSNFAEREVASIALAEIAKQEADNIRVTEPARPPLTGSSLKVPVALIGALFALFSALMAGLLRATMRNQFSTARSIERTMGVPVIASVRKR